MQKINESIELMHCTQRIMNQNIQITTVCVYCVVYFLRSWGGARVLPCGIKRTRSFCVIKRRECRWWMEIN